MKSILKIALSTTLLVSTSFMATNAVAVCNGSTPVCPITVNTSRTLTSDCQGAINIIGNNLTLNLGGHTVCQGNTVVFGNKVKIKNGYVKENVLILGNKSQVENITLLEYNSFGVVIDGNKPSVRNSRIQNKAFALLVAPGGKYASLVNNTLKDNEWSLLTEAKQGTFLLNQVNSNEFGVFLNTGAKFNKLYFNTAYFNTEYDAYQQHACGSNTWFLNTIGT